MSKARIVVTLLIALCASAALAAWVLQARRVEEGRALYAGERALPGRIVGHDLDLPVQASRCVNCHGSAATPVEVFAPRLDGGDLMRLQPRRGGPPSRYDAAALCTLLRTGVDPAHVVIPRTMPRYRASDADCEALWAHLVSG